MNINVAGLKQTNRIQPKIYTPGRKRQTVSDLSAVHRHSNDSAKFAPVVIQSSKIVQFNLFIVDAACDNEHNYRLRREVLDIAKTVILLNPRRSRK